MFFAAISREDGEDSNHHNIVHHRGGHANNHGNKVPYNGYNSEEFLDRLEPNGNIPANKSDLGYGKREYSRILPILFYFVCFCCCCFVSDDVVCIIHTFRFDIICVFRTICPLFLSAKANVP